MLRKMAVAMVPRVVSIMAMVLMPTMASIWCNIEEASEYCTPGALVATCPAGKYGFALSENQSCVSCCDCENNYYCPGGTNRLRCPAGKYQNNGDAGKASEISCLSCKENHYCPSPMILTNETVAVNLTGWDEQKEVNFDNSLERIHGPFGIKTSLSRTFSEINQYFYNFYQSVIIHIKARIFAINSWDDGDRAYVKIGQKKTVVWQSPHAAGEKSLWKSMSETISDEPVRSIDVDIITTIHRGEDALYLEFSSQKSFAVARIFVTSQLKLEPCPPGKYINETSQSSKTACRQCEIGSFCSGELNFQKKFCPPGRYGSEPSQTSVASCHTCSKGYYCDGIVGTRSPCPPGRYTQNEGSKICEVCPVGFICSGNAEQHQCIAGRYGNQTGQYSMESCSECEVGYACAGGDNKIGCLNGTYSNRTSQTTCKSCEAGYICPSLGVRKPCAVGKPIFQQAEYYCPPRSMSPWKTAIGYISLPSDSPVNVRERQGPCPKGRLCRYGKLADLQLCRGGTTGATGVMIDGCKGGCPPGYFCPPGARMPGQDYPCGGVGVFCPANVSVPQQVREGFYSGPLIDSPVNKRFLELPCKPGHYCTKGEIIPCPAGFFGATVKLNSSKCSGKCEINHFCRKGSTSPRDSRIDIWLPAHTSIVSGIPNRIGAALISEKNSRIVDQSTRCHVEDISETPALRLTNEINLGQGNETIEFSITNSPGLTRNLLLRCQQFQNEDNFQFYFNVTISLCNKGEVFDKSEKVCRECAPGTYIWTVNATQCLKCPIGGECLGGSRVVPLQGYFWEDGPSKPRFAACPNPDACLGNSSCAEGYAGFACAKCDNGYGFSIGSNERAVPMCRKCPPSENNILVLILIIALIVCWVGHTIFMKVIRVKRRASVLRVFITFLQFQSFATYLSIKWPSPSDKYMSVQASLASINPNVASIDCMMRAYRLHGSAFITKSMFLLVTPISLLLVFALIMTLLWYSKKGEDSKRSVKNKAIAVIIFAEWFAWSAVTQSTMDLFSCRHYGSEYRLRMDLDIICWKSEEHVWAIRNIAIPSLLIHVIGAPLLVCLDVYYKFNKRNRSEKHFKLLMERYGFLLAGYANHVYGWELTVLVRKLLILVACVFLSDLPSMQVTFVSWMATMALMAHIFVQPYGLDQFTILSPYSKAYKEQICQNVFDCIDDDHDGVISLLELHHALSQHGYSIDAETLVKELKHKRELDMESFWDIFAHAKTPVEKTIKHYITAVNDAQVLKRNVDSEDHRQRHMRDVIDRSKLVYRLELFSLLVIWFTFELGHIAHVMPYPAAITILIINISFICTFIYNWSVIVKYRVNKFFLMCHKKWKSFVEQRKLPKPRKRIRQPTHLINLEMTASEKTVSDHDIITRNVVWNVNPIAKKRPEARALAFQDGNAENIHL